MTLQNSQKKSELNKLLICVNVFLGTIDVYGANMAAQFPI